MWIISIPGGNQWAALTPVPEENEDLFEVNGMPKQWQHRPRLQTMPTLRRKKPLPVSDISAFDLSSLLLNQRAADALGNFLRQFGQLLECDCGGDVMYFYNVTQLISCINLEKSELRHGRIWRECLDVGKVPAGAQIFKDPLTASAVVYVNEEARLYLETLCATCHLTGLVFQKISYFPTS